MPAGIATLVYKDSAGTNRNFLTFSTTGDLTEVRAQLGEQLGWSHHRHACGRELYRQREMIDARADRCDRSLRFGIRNEAFRRECRIVEIATRQAVAAGA